MLTTSASLRDRALRLRVCVLISVVAVSSGLLVAAPPAASASKLSATVTPTVPQVTVNFGMQPYPPHTSAIIALDQGWFKDVGINLKWQNLQGTALGSALVAGTVNLVSAAPSQVMPSMAQGHFTTIVFNDLFEAYALMASPTSKFKTFSQFLAEGQTPQEAMHSAVAQMKGHIFTQEGEGAEKPFIDYMLSLGGLTASQVSTVITLDANGVALMLSGRADFELGGLPARITLEQHHFKDIITAAEVAQYAKASSTSPALVAITHVGWTAYTNWANANPDTVLRLASVAYRITQFQNAHQAQAIAMHVPLLNKLAGAAFTDAEMKVIYDKLDPDYTFAMQGPTFYNPKSPLYWKYEVQADINSYVQSDLFKKGQFVPSDIVSADKIYAQLLNYKNQASAALTKLRGATGEAGSLAKQAESYYTAFDFLDAARFAAAAVKMQGA